LIKRNADVIAVCFLLAVMGLVQIVRQSPVVHLAMEFGVPVVQGVGSVWAGEGPKWLTSYARWTGDQARSTVQLHKMQAQIAAQVRRAQAQAAAELRRAQKQSAEQQCQRASLQEQGARIAAQIECVRAAAVSHRLELLTSIDGLREVRSLQTLRVLRHDFTAER
jgi:hypothetical protein